MARRYYAAEDPDYAEAMPEHCWRVYDRTDPRRKSVLLSEETAERDAWRLEQDRYRPFGSEEEADEAADAQAPYWGEQCP